MLKSIYLTGELHAVRWLCDTTWHWYNGLHGIGIVFHAGEPWQTCHTHRLSGRNTGI